MAAKGGASMNWVFFSLLLLSFLDGLIMADGINVQGSIFCLSPGHKAKAIKGATTRILCKGLDDSAFSIISTPTDDNGFYTATSSTSPKSGSCKAFLNSSPMASCRTPTNTNNGKSGASLIAFSSDKSNKNFSVKPLAYAPK